MERESRALEFGKPCQAVQIKLTDTLLEALLNAQKTGQRVSMNVGKHNEIIVGNDKFPFTAHEAKLQDIVRVPHDADQSCTEVAQVVQRLHVQRVVTEAERERVRQRGLDAEMQRRGRTAQVLDKAPKPEQGRKSVHNTLARSTTPSIRVGQQKPPAQPVAPPPAHFRDPTPPIRNPMPALRTPTPPPQRNTPPPSGSAVAPKARPQPLSKLGKPKRPTPTPGTGLLVAPPLAMEAARRKLGLRKVLIACIATDRPKKPRLDQMLQSISSGVLGFKYGKDEVTRILKSIADYKAPGVYVLTDYIQKRELGPLQQELGPASEEPSRTPSLEVEISPTTTDAAAADLHKEQAEAGRLSQPARNAAPIIERSSFAAEGEPALKDGGERQQARHPDKGAEPLKRAKKEKEPALRAASQPGESPTGGSHEAVRHKKKKRRLVKTPPETDVQTGATPSPLQEPAANGHGRASGTNNSSSGDADISWFEEFVRPARQEGVKISNRAEFDELFDRHSRMFRLYDELGRKIARFKGEYQALVASSQAAGTEEQRQTFEVQAERYYSDRVGRVRQMDTAFKTLHAELTDTKEALSQFYSQQRSSVAHKASKQVSPKSVAAS